MTSSSRPSGPADHLLPEIIVLDACVLLNLFATRRIEDILGSLSSRYLVSSYARSEALWYLVPGGGPETPERRNIDLEPIAAAGLIEIVELTIDEQNTFVEFARELGDGEAASGAIAASRSAAVATDDAKARQVFARRIPSLTVVSTSALLRSWEARSAVRRIDVAGALEAIQLGARYSPRRGDDDAIWWQDRIQEISRH